MGEVRAVAGGGIKEASREKREEKRGGDGREEYGGRGPSSERDPRRGEGGGVQTGAEGAYFAACIGSGVKQGISSESWKVNCGISKSSVFGSCFILGASVLTGSFLGVASFSCRVGICLVCGFCDDGFILVMPLAFLAEMPGF